MKNLQKTSRELQEKSTWIRKGMQDFLENWKTATNEELHDSTLQKLVICSRWENDNQTRYFLYIERGCSKVYTVWDEDWAHDNFDTESSFNLEYIDMKTLRHVINNLSKSIKVYSEKLNKASIEYEEILSLLK